MLESQFPAHPRFGVEEIKIGLLRKVQDEVERAAQAPDGRIAVDKPLRPLMLQIAVPLKLGEMGETHFVLGRHWYSHFNRQVQGPITVGRLRAALDEPTPDGPAAACAEPRDPGLCGPGQPFLLPARRALPAEAGRLPDELELREQALPSPGGLGSGDPARGQDLWHRGLAAAQREQRQRPRRQARHRRAGRQEACQAVMDRLDGLCEDWGIDPATCARQQTARAVLALVRGLAAATTPRRGWRPWRRPRSRPRSTRWARAYRKAAAVQSAIAATKWDLLAAASRPDR